MHHAFPGPPIGRAAVFLGVLAASLSTVTASDGRPNTVGPPPPSPASAETALDAGWFVVTDESGQAYSRPPGTPGSYAVASLPIGRRIRVIGFEDGAATVAAAETDASIRGLLLVDDAISIEGDTARVLSPTEIRTPNLAGRDEGGRPDPRRSYQTMFEFEGGESIVITDRFDADGRGWLEVEPPADAVLFVPTEQIRVATAEEPTETARPPVAAIAAPQDAPDRRSPEDEFDFPDGRRGRWRAIRNQNQRIRTGPGASNSYAMARLDKGDVVAVVEELPDGWCSVRLVGPDLEGVRGLLRAEPGAIEVQDMIATVRRGDHDVMAPSLAGDADEPDPVASYLVLTRVGEGRSLAVTRTFEGPRGETWLEVIPPLDAVGWIHGGYLKSVRPDQRPREVGRDAAGRPIYGTRPIEPEASAEIPVTEPETTVEITDPEATDGEAVEPEVVIEPEAEPEPEPEPEMIEPEVIVEAEVVVEPEVDLIENETTTTDPETESEIVLEPETEPEPAPAPILSAEMLADVTIADAEAKYVEIRSSPENDAEFEALELIYQAISERPSTPASDRSRAEVRLEQIQIQRDLQRRIDTLRRLENRANIDRERIEAIREALLDRADYTAIGRLSRSRVYDGRTLPRLYRLEDPTSGRTIAYVSPNDALSIDSGVGRIVGIVGTEREDPGYRIRVIRPDRFEIDLIEEISDR